MEQQNKVCDGTFYVSTEVYKLILNYHKWLISPVFDSG